MLFLFQKEEIYLNLVLDFVPETVYRVARHYSKAKQTIPILYIKVSHVEEHNIIVLIVSVTKYSPVIGSPHAYLLRNCSPITWISNYRCPI